MHGGAERGRDCPSHRNISLGFTRKPRPGWEYQSGEETVIRSRADFKLNAKGEGRWEDRKQD